MTREFPSPYADLLPSGPDRNGSRPRNDRFPENSEEYANLSHITEDAPEPVLVEPWQQFPVEQLPRLVAEYVTEAADALGCDPAMVALPLLTSLASAIGNTRRIELKRVWTEPAIVWTAVVAESGSLKSPAIEAGTVWPRQKQADSFEQYRTELEQFRSDEAEYKLDVARWRKKPDGPSPMEPERPIAWRCVVSDVTVEALAPILQQQPRGVMLCRDELGGWLAGFNQYKAGRGSDVEHWLELHRGGNLTVDRKSTGPLFVPNAAVSVTGGIQPEPLGQALGTEHFQNGLAARFLLAMPPRKPKRWSEREVDFQLIEQLRLRFVALYSLEFDPDGQPLRLPLDDEGQRLWREFVNEWGEATAELSGKLAALNAKLESYAARLALIIQLSEQPESPIVTWPAVERAIILTRWFQRENRRIYQRFTESPSETVARELLEFIVNQGGEVSIRDLMRKGPRFSTADQAERALKPLIHSGLVEVGTVGTRTNKATVYRATAAERYGGGPANAP